MPVGELVAAGLGGARSRAIAFKAIADGLPPQYRLRTRLVRAPYPQVRLARVTEAVHRLVTHVTSSASQSLPHGPNLCSRWPHFQRCCATGWTCACRRLMSHR